jgi:lactate dehydrogenase-like 2-hydroxyacid dehydrogenase
MKPTVYVAQPIPEVALAALREVADVTVYPYMDQQITAAELAAGAKHADWLFVMHETDVNADVLNANPNLKGIGCMGRTKLHIDMDVANARKIPVVSTDPTSGTSRVTGDLAIALMLGLAYRLVESDVYTRGGNFRQEQTMALMGLGCPGKTAGLIGLGKVGVFVVPRLRAFDMSVVYTKRTRLPLDQEKAMGVEWAPHLDDVIKRSDYLFILCNYNESTHKLIGKRELDLLKKDAYLINVGRGRIIDEPELVKALQEKRIAGAGLDVYYNEPYQHDPHPTGEPWVPVELRNLDNVILQPHNGGGTWDVRGANTLSVAKGLIQLMKGERPATLVNPEIYGNT